ncbi:MAG: nucleotide exchange factor GrpE [Clostridia bacterium]|nr:nucleotide exchange factor GrpE [Clostridia bacterium]
MAKDRKDNILDRGQGNSDDMEHPFPAPSKEADNFSTDAEAPKETGNRGCCSRGEETPEEENDNGEEPGHHTDRDCMDDLESEIKCLHEQLEIKDAQIAELIVRAKRIQGEFDNYRKRTIKEKEEAAHFAAADLIQKLLPVFDNFERAVTAGQDACQGETFAVGIEMIFKQLLEVLMEEGLKPVPSIGEQFDPKWHEAVMRVENSECEENTVIEEVQKGYILNDRVIRPAMVKVSFKN